MTVIRPRKDWQFNAHYFPRSTVCGAAAAVDVLLRCLSISESPFRRRVFNISALTTTRAKLLKPK